MRNKERNERLKLLEIQKKLNDTHCNPCIKIRESGVSACNKCSIKEELNHIGKHLSQIRKSTKANTIAEEILRQSETPYGLVLTTERLSILEKAGFRTYQIEEMYGLSKKELYDWKKHRGLIKARPRKNKGQDLCSS